MIKRRGEATIIALVLLALFIISLIATLFIVNSAINTYMETSKKVFRNVEEKRAEDLTILDIYLDDADSTLIIKVRNSGDIYLGIISIWINNTNIQLNSTIYLSPEEVRNIDTGYQIDESKKYIVEIVSERGRIYYGKYPMPKPQVITGRWEHISYSPVIFTPGSTATYADETYTINRFYPTNYDILNGSLISGSLESLYYDDSDYMILKSVPLSSIEKSYYANSYYNLIGSIISGDTSSLRVSDDAYLVIDSSPILTESTLYTHSELYTVGPTEHYMLKTVPGDGARLIINYNTTDDEWHPIASFVYPLSGLDLQSRIWHLYYRVKVISSAGGGVLPGWLYYKPIVITEKTNEDLTNYQVRIVLNADNFNFDHAKQDGSDIRFLDSDQATLLNYWIEKWDYNNKEAIIWVKIPYLRGGSTKTIYLYYGNPDATYDPDHYGLNRVMEQLPANDGDNYMIYYQEWIMPENKFQRIGDPMGWHSDDYQWRYRLPFNLPYYSGSYKYIAIASNGYIQVNGGSGWSDWSSTLNEFKNRKYISPYWADLMTIAPRDIYIERVYTDEYGDGIYIRWYTAYYYRRGVQNFAAALYKNGLIRFDYGYFSGSSYTDGTPVIGVSYGDNQHYTVSSYNNIRNPSYYNSILFWPRKKASIEPGVSVGDESLAGGGYISADISVLDSEGNVIHAIGSKVASAYIGVNDTWITVSGDFNFPGYTSNEGEYLEIKYCVRGLSNIPTQFYLDIDNQNLSENNQTRIELPSHELPSKYIFSIELEGSSNTAWIWNNITFTLESHYDYNEVKVNISLYDYELDRFSQEGEEGFLSFVYSGSPADVIKSGNVRNNPKNYRDDDGNWKIKINGYRDTFFNERFKVYLDYLMYKVSFVNKYGVKINLYFNNVSLENLYRLIISSKMKYNSTGLILYYKVYNFSISDWSLVNSWVIDTSIEKSYNNTFISDFTSIVSNGLFILRMNTTLLSDDASPFEQFIDVSYLDAAYKISGAIYVGRGDSNETYIYIISNDTWKKVSDAPFIWDGIARLLFISSNKMIYAFNETCLYMYNTTDGIWRLISILPEEASHGASISYSRMYQDIIIYIPGGGSRSAYIYNLTSGVWSNIRNIPEAVSSYSMAVGADNGCIYLITGRDSGGFYKYNITSNEWIKIGVAPASELSGMTYYGEYIYISDLDGGLYRYTISNNTWCGLIPVIPVKSDGEGNRLLTDGSYLYYLRFDYTAEALRISIQSLRIY